eukprot:gene12952-17471_t
MRTLRASAAPEAREAIDLFVYRIVREIGSLAAALGGVDSIVFTAGIGERDPATRAEISAGCAWLGLKLDPALNAAGNGRISVDSAAVSAWVVPTDEQRMIARYTRAALRGHRHVHGRAPDISATQRIAIAPEHVSSAERSFDRERAIGNDALIDALDRVRLVAEGRDEALRRELHP